ncbi:MarR family winged helix-turn-helix transcriptional regulator [Sporosalibacterium faouarense]|uniref:MarR family winged helix-turn-helix transcriptional regulator n=1 Tax=Sporosalibacterium faouarense TaxID=516123 RepID=UPI00141C21E4|nr:MarR family transcriptional regulator [Sporosalibacterium faouarense]MTI49565.1 MarR family transcriptional regulator [Bacillota bacterium]
MDKRDVNISGQIQDLLKRINMRARHVMIKEFDKKELTMHQIFIMKTIEKHRNINLTTLGNQLNLSKSSICLTINKLVEEGYVLRKEDPEDRRNKLILLSEYGIKAMNESKNASRKIFSDLLTGLNHNELEEIKNSLIKLENFMANNAEKDY